MNKKRIIMEENIKLIEEWSRDGGDIDMPETIGTSNTQDVHIKDTLSKDDFIKKIKTLEKEYKTKNPGCSNRNVKRYILRNIKTMIK